MRFKCLKGGGKIIFLDDNSITTVQENQLKCVRKEEQYGLYERQNVRKCICTIGFPYNSNSQKMEQVSHLQFTKHIKYLDKLNKNIKVLYK